MQEHAARTGRRHVAITDEAWRPAPAVFACFEALFEQLLRGIAPPEPERDGQSQHQRAEGDRKGRQHDRRRQPQLFERHDDGNRDHQEPQRAAEQTRGRQPRVDRRQQRGAPDEVAHQESQGEHQQRQQDPGHERRRTAGPVP